MPERPKLPVPGRPLRPWTAPGASLGYARDLVKLDQWPPRRKPPTRDPARPSATAFLVVPFDPADAGVRPVADALVQYSAGIRILDAAGAAVIAPVAGQTYTVEAAVANRGVAPAYLGLAGFYAAPAADIDAAAAGGPRPPAIGHAGFILNPAAATVVRCPRPWSPRTPQEAAATLIVEAYDPTSDMLTSAFDANTDRHVGRRDPIADFSGVWSGRLKTIGARSSSLVQLAITQSTVTISMAYHRELAGAVSAISQWTGSGAVSGDQATGLTTETRDGAPFMTNAWSLTLTGPNALKVLNHREYIAGGPRIDTQIDTGTLTR